MINSMEFQITGKRRMRVKLIFNPTSGKNKESPVQLLDIMKELQNWRLIAEPFLIEPDCDLDREVQDALSDGIRMFIVCGGDGTVSSVARTLMGTTATLGIIPIGTRNNIALSLGIPTDIPQAIALLRAGQRLKIDMGMSICDGKETPFIEICSVGLFSTLFSAGDDIQHGKISRIGDFLSTLINTPPSKIHLVLDNNKEVEELGHVVLITNMSYVGVNYQVGSQDSFHDGFLDVLFFADLSKMQLLGYVLKGPESGDQEDPRIGRYRVRSVTIDTDPAMPIMADSITIGEGKVQVEIKKKALTVMVKPQEPTAETGERNGE